MRITNSLIYSNAITNMARAREREEASANQSATGLRVSTPGDDPAAAGLITRQTLAGEKLDAISTAVGRASDELTSADSAMSSLGNVLEQAKELATRMANSTYSSDERASAASTIQGLMGEAVAALNTQVGNRYIFGGTADSAPPFAADGTYNGDTNVRSVEIAPGISQQSSVRADVMAKGAGGGVDIFATLNSLATALNANDTAGIAAALDPLATTISQVADTRSQAGSAQNLLESAASVSKAGKSASDLSVGKLQDADAIASASNLSLAEQALEASLSASAKTFQLTLVDKL